MRYKNSLRFALPRIFLRHVCRKAMQSVVMLITVGGLMPLQMPTII